MREQIISMIIVLIVVGVLMYLNYRRRTKGLREKIVKLYSQCQAVFGALRVQAYNKGFEDCLAEKVANSEETATEAAKDVLSWLGFKAVALQFLQTLTQEAGTYYIQGYDNARQGRENWAVDILNAAAKKGQSLFEYLSELSYCFASGQASREAKEVAARLALEREQLELLGERLQVEQYKLESLRVKLEALRQEAEAAGA